MPEPSPDFEARLTAVEQRLDVVAADAVAARHLAAANDRDYADLALKLDALRAALNAHAEQTAASLARHDEVLARHDQAFARYDQAFARYDEAFGRHDQAFAQLAAGQERIVELLTTVIAKQDE